MLKVTTCIFLLSTAIIGGCQNDAPFQVEVSPNSQTVITDQIQRAIDSCAAQGGGTVFFPAGKYLSGGLHLKSNVTLHLDKGATLQGSSRLEDYGEWKWTNALIMGDSLENVAIVGQGTLDGIDLKNPQGEAGFRGPHAIRLTHCDSITIQGITIVRSANWAMNFRYCSRGYVENVKVRGGHDALHTRFCNNFTVRDCDFRTGDDCFAGNDNRDFDIQNCKLNTSCNAFRLGCLNLVVKNCSIWGPGEYKHIKQNRNNTLSAFVHFSPEDEDPKLVSGNWLIQDVTVHHVDNVFNYNFRNGLWQTGQPATDITFENLTATDVKKSFNIIGDSARSLQLTLKNSSLSERPATDFTSMTFEGRTVEVPAFFNATRFDVLTLDDVTITTNNADPAVMAQDGNRLVLNSIKYLPSDNKFSLLSEDIGEVVKN